MRRISSQKMAAAAASLVWPGLNFRCMKYRMTRMALTEAMAMATTVLNRPRSTVAIQTVTAVRTSNIAKMVR